MPKPYVRKMPVTWWLTRRAYFYFMLRELTAVLVAAYCLVLLIMLWRLRQGPTEFETFLDQLAHPRAIGFHFVALVAAIYHAATWFNLMPQIMVIRLGEEKVPPVLLLAANGVIWLVASAVLVWLVILP